jgi:hypothetical protein
MTIVMMENAAEIQPEAVLQMPKRPIGFPENLPFEIREDPWAHGFGADRFFSGFKVDGTQFELKPRKESSKRSKFERFDYREKQSGIWGEFSELKIKKSAPSDA